MAETRTERYLPALRFKRLTPLFDVVVAAAARERAFKERVIALAGVEPGDDVLDVGCGTGTLGIAAAEAGASRVVGIDPDPDILARARRKAERSGSPVVFEEALSTALPFAAESFDLVLSTLVFHHLDDEVKRGSAREALRVLRPGGRLLLGDYGRPQDPLMRAAVLQIQVFDGFGTTSLNVAGGLSGVLSAAGFADVAVVDRMRTPTGTVEVVSASRPGTVQA